MLGEAHAQHATRVNASRHGTCSGVFVPVPLVVVVSWGQHISTPGGLTWTLDGTRCSNRGKKTDTPSTCIDLNETVWIDPSKKHDCVPFT